jgi:NAD(P)-dependent dehydrogenase (short-subunit alcohol dehydrogenase family)
VVVVVASAGNCLFHGCAAGRLDILFNNAGIADPQALQLHEYPTANWRAVLDVDLDGVFFCAREALKVMVAQQSGKIINIASIWGLAGSSSLFPALAYNAAKGAVVNLTRELGLEYARQGIQVNALCPGFYRTNLSRGAIDDPQARALPRLSRIRLHDRPDAGHRRRLPSQVTSPSSLLRSLF